MKAQTFDEYLWDHMPPVADVDPIIPSAKVAGILDDYRAYARRLSPSDSDAKVEHLARVLFNGMMPDRVARRLARNDEWERSIGFLVWPDPLRPATTKALCLTRDRGE